MLRSRYHNTCTYRHDVLVASKAPRAFFRIGVTTIGKRGAGEIIYR